MSGGPIEPDAGSRIMAHALHQMYLALCLEGFSEYQALAIIGQILYANGASQPPQQEGK